MPRPLQQAPDAAGVNEGAEDGHFAASNLEVGVISWHSGGLKSKPARNRNPKMAPPPMAAWHRGTARRSVSFQPWSKGPQGSCVLGASDRSFGTGRRGVAAAWLTSVVIGLAESSEGQGPEGDGLVTRFPNPNPTCQLSTAMAARMVSTASKGHS